ncbi:T6SS effector BTH_I2691 family protein [Ferribacterium limneticum]|uniref:T6SS effector BTH_I2691 family protein n=1 Tax=Ferribacterium limneticum TaxID=76259 RepID=UPI001CFA2F98|nr:T6SS effector BTH_I2691 family protein [Ferribacterium limneticum]UCV30279.1 hypothetical protein KI617_09490 [Ferribacterium limneticum]UCV34198.1 hypothetical protein KI608_09490 [Ferribacterium limneticum]
MTTAQMCANPCETCKKEGLPLLLTRYAVHAKESQAPVLTGQLGGGALASIPVGKHAQYGLRLLRSGYVYVYDEARKHWDEYFVTADGFLTKLPPRPKTGTRAAPATEFACARNGAAPLAGVITIRNPKHATNIWIGFSDVEWTDDTLTKHNDAAYRQRHMQKVVISGGKVNPQPHTAPLDKVDSVVPEFKIDAATVKKQIEPWCPFPFNSRVAQAKDFKAAVQQARPQGGAAVVALFDPIGLAMELAALMDLRKLAFTKAESEAKPHFAASTIAQLELTIKGQAKLSEILSGDELANQMLVDGGAANLLDSYQKQVERVRNPTPAELQRAADKQWRTYTHTPAGKPRFDEATSKNWLNTYNDKLQKYDAEHILPLAKAHAAWMKHTSLTEYMTCNFDEADPESGVAYTKVCVDLLRHTTDKQPSYDLYLGWLKNGEFAAENLVMRAMAFNQKELVEKINKADAAAVDSRAFPTDGVAAAVAAFMEKMPPTANVQLAGLLAGISGPALKYWDDFNVGKVGPKAAAAMAAVTGKQIVRLPVVGNKGQFIQAHVKQLFRLDPNLKTSANQLQKAVAAQVRLLEIEGVPTQAKSKLGWYVLLDREVVAGATTKNLSGQALADELAKAINKPQDLQKIDLGRAAKIRGGAYASATVLSGILMLWNFSKLLEDVEKGMSHEQTEAASKLMAGKIAIAGFVAEQMGNGLEKLGEARLKNMMGRATAYAPRALQWFGRFAGFGVGVFLGLWDLSKWWDERAKGDPSGIAGAYFVSGAAGISVATTMLFVGMGWVALGPIGWIVLAIGVLIWLVAIFFVENTKDNKLQEWLSRCHFGTGNDKYPNVTTHAEQYKLALAD